MINQEHLERLRWWQKNKRLSIDIIIVFAGVAALIFVGYWFHWTWIGFFNKTLWDWMQLLIVPVVIAAGGLWFNQVQHNREQRATKQHVETEHEIANASQREVALQSYLDRMSEVLLRENLRKSEQDADVRKIARSRTLTVLRRLDADRKASLLMFLYESCLIENDRNGSIIGLNGADLKEANLFSANLSNANLSRAILHKADLYTAKLSNANLSGADLFGANLSGADLGGASLSGTILHNADLNNANLNNANLSNVDLSGAKNLPHQLDQAKLRNDII